MAVSASTPRPGTGPNGDGVLPVERLRVDGGGDRHVAALAVGEHEQARGARVRADGLERERAGEAEPLEARELGLGGDAGGPGGVDQRERVREHGGRRLERGRLRLGRRGAGDVARDLVRGGEALREVRPRLGRMVERSRPQAGGIGIDPEDDLRLARRDGGGEAIAEGLTGRRRPVAGARRRHAPAT